MGMAGKDILSEKSFPIICRAIIKRYIDQAEVIKERKHERQHPLRPQGKRAEKSESEWKYLN